MKDFKTFSDFMNQINEIFLVTPAPKRKSSATRSASKPKIGKPDPYDPYYVEKMRKWAKQQQQEETSVSEDMEQRWERQAAEREQYRREREARRKKREQTTRERDIVTTKGIRGTHKGKWGTFKGGVFTPDN